MHEKGGELLKREGWIVEGIYLNFIVVRDCILVFCVLITLYIRGKVLT